MDPWASEIIALPLRMSRIKFSGIINYRQCVVLKSLAEYTANYVEFWITVFREETKATSTVALGRELLRVLNRGLHIFQLCADRQSQPVLLVSAVLGGSGEFYEIVDDVRRYSRMLNNLIVNAPSFQSKSNHVKLEVQVLEQLKRKIEYDCDILRITLKWACNQGKLTLLRRLESEEFSLLRGLLESVKSQSGTVGRLFKLLWGPDARILGNIPKKFLTACLIPFLETGLLPTALSINYRDLTVDLDLDKGTNGMVKRAMWCKLPVAVKEFPFEDRFESELKMFRKVLSMDSSHKGAMDSSHIVQFLGHTENNGRKCLVIELMDTDLEKLIAKKTENKNETSPEEITPFSLPVSVDIMLQIAKGMRNLHSVDIIYRDLKPNNVLVKIREDGTFLVKLADFGESKGSFKTKSVQTELKGTVMYMAPEILQGKGKYSRKVDVYSFAIVCAKILTGRLPFSPEQSIGELKELIVKRGIRPELPTHIPTRLSFLSICWELLERPSFAEICDELWLIKEQLLTANLEIDINQSSIERSDVPMMPQISTPTRKKAILCYGRECLLSRYFVKNLPIDFLTDIQFGHLAVESSGNLTIVDLPDTLHNEWNILQNPFTDGNGLDPQNSPDSDNPTEDLGILGQFKKLLKDQDRKFNLILAIGGWDYSKYFSDAFSTGKRRDTFINSVVKFLKDHPIFNGICINWQYVSEDGVNYGKQDNIVRREDGDNLILVLKELKDVLPRGFTISVPSRARPEQAGWPIEKAIHLIDQLHVVANDFHEGSKVAVHKSNLYLSSGAVWSVDEAIEYHLCRGVPYSKLFIGTSLCSSGFANTEGMGKPADGESPNGCVRYCELPVPGSEEIWDDDAKASYAYDPVRRIVDTYDNIRSIVEKAKYIKDNKLGGIILWEICSDYPSSHERSIVKALHRHLTHG